MLRLAEKPAYKYVQQRILKAISKSAQRCGTNSTHIESATWFLTASDQQKVGGFRSFKHVLLSPSGDKGCEQGIECGDYFYGPGC